MTQLTLKNAQALTIISLCDFSGAWSKPYADAGYNVRRVDLEGSGEDVRLLHHIEGPVHGLLAAPPGQHLASSVARWWKSKGEEALIEAMSIVDAFLRIVALKHPKFWAIENPIGRLVHHLGAPSLRFDPGDYAAFAPNPAEEQYTKRTCLWGEFNAPERGALPPVLGSKMHKLPDSSWRKKARQKTPDGFAAAFFLANP